MPNYYLVHAGTELFVVNVSTGVATEIALPAGVTLDSTKRARFAILDRQIVGAHAFSRNIVFDVADLTTRLLSIDGPGTTATVADGGAGNLSGEYRYKVTFAIIDSGDVLTESPFSTSTAPITVSSRQVSLSAIPTSLTAGVNARRIYRTTNGGVDYFLLTTLNDNSTTVYVDNTSDYDLALLPTADDLGNPPGSDGNDYFRLLVAWKDRLWGSPNSDPDLVYFSENRKVWGWAPVNSITVKPVGQDLYGVTAFMARRDDLLIGRRRALWMLRGTGPADFTMIQVAEGVGPIGQDCAIVTRDTAYFLAEDGLYEYGPEGLKNLARDDVYEWFTTDETFERVNFPSAFLAHDPRVDVLHLLLPAAGGSTLNRWVTYDIRRKYWLGPHKTDAATPTSQGVMDDPSGTPVMFLGTSAGDLLQFDPALVRDEDTDDAAVAIDWDAILKFHSMNTPDIQKYFGELSIISAIQATGTLTITPSVGGLDASEAAAISHDMTLGRQRLRRLGTGRFLRLRLRNNVVNQQVEVYGLEVPYHELGRR